MPVERSTPTAGTLPGLVTLEQTPRILETLLIGATPEALEWKPAPDRWSISQVLAHLLHVEVEGFHLRARQFLEKENPVLGTYDQNALAAAGVYSGQEARKTLAEFQRERGKSLDFLRTLSREALEKKAQHPQLGEVTLGQLLHEWAFHDLGHIRQIAELYRAKVYWPGMGGWQRYYKINP